MSDGLALELDHLVVAAATLGEGLAWCEATLGHVPDAGGKHAFMGTHNRIFAVGSAQFPRAYGEIIAIDPDGAAPPRPRWFGLDDPALQQAIAAGPRLIHWVARCVDIGAAAEAFRAAGFDPGAVVEAERMTPRGLLRWRITVRPDGRRLCDGALPTLIEWGDVHPSASLPASGVALAGVTLAGVPDAIGARLGGAVALDRSAALAPTVDRSTTIVARAPAPMVVSPGRSPPRVVRADRSARTATRLAAPISIALDTPRGRVTLDSLRLES